jgi:hypothetical protein
MLEVLAPFLKPSISALIQHAPRLFGWLSKTMPLHVAARLLYEDARRHKTLLASAAERMGGVRSADDILNYMATYIAQDYPIFGARAPSTISEAIDPMMARTGTFSDGAKLLRIRDRANSEFTDLKIERNVLRRVRKELRESQ